MVYSYRASHDVEITEFQRRTPSSTKQLLNAIQETSERLQRDSPPSSFHLSLPDVSFTSQRLNLVIELLTLELPLGEKGEKLKWMVTLSNCRLKKRTTDDCNCANKYRYASSNDISRLGTTLSLRTSTLKIDGCSRAIMNCLLSVPFLDMHELSICDGERMNASKCLRLGALMDRSVNLKILYVDTSTMKTLEPLASGLVAGGSHLESLSLKGRAAYEPDQDLPALMAAVLQLLQMPDSSLKCLELTYMGVTDEHLMAILPILCVSSNHNNGCSRLQELKLPHNKLDCPSILDLAHRLPDIKFLKKIDIGYNPWVYNVEKIECLKALSYGSAQNHSMESLSHCSRHEVGTLFYQPCRLNRIKRRILTSTVSVSLAYWPNVFEYIGHSIYNYPSRLPEYCLSKKEVAASAVFFLLRNGPTDELLFRGQV